MPTESPDIENKLLLRLEEGDEYAFSEVFNLFYQRLLYMIIKIVGDQDDAKDILSEVFVKFWDKRIRFESLSALKAYLYVAARNRSLDFLKIKKRQDASKTGYAYWIDHPEEVSALILNAELAAQLEQEIQSLPAKCRQIVQLAYYEELSSEQIAERLGISIQTVWNQKTTALKKLRAAFIKNKLTGAGLLSYISLLEMLKN